MLSFNLRQTVLFIVFNLKGNCKCTSVRVYANVHLALRNDALITAFLAIDEKINTLNN